MNIWQCFISAYHSNQIGSYWASQRRALYSHDPNKHACTRSFFFKDLAPSIWLVRAYTFIKFSKLQNLHIKKHGKRLFNTAIITGFNMILLFLLHFSSKKGFLLNITCQYLNDKSTLYVQLEHFCPICLKILWNCQPSMFIWATRSFGS